jgi:hypothetical protein
MNALGWLVLGLLLGWAIEFAIDYLYWRRKAQAEAEALAQQEAALNAQQTEMGHRQSTLRLREKEMSDLQASLASRDAELLQQARRVEERSDDLSRVEQAIEKRRADLDRMGLTLNEREKEIATRGDQLRTKEVNYNRRLDTLENTEAELARRVAVVTNREEAMQSWEGRILSREHDVADREASVNYHANRIARDAGSFEAVKHLLRQHYRTAEGRDRLQALVGIDDKAAELLKNAGIRNFERLAESSIGELTRLLEGAGSRLALANPLSWAEQANAYLAEDWVTLDRLQAELKGEHRDDVTQSLLEAMQRSSGVAGAGTAAAAPDTATPAPAPAPDAAAAVSGAASAAAAGDAVTVGNAAAAGSAATAENAAAAENATTVENAATAENSGPAATDTAAAQHEQDAGAVQTEGQADDSSDGQGSASTDGQSGTSVPAGTGADGDETPAPAAMAAAAVVTGLATGHAATGAQPAVDAAAETSADAAAETSADATAGTSVDAAVDTSADAPAGSTSSTEASSGPDAGAAEGHAQSGVPQEHSHPAHASSYATGGYTGTSYSGTSYSGAAGHAHDEAAERAAAGHGTRTPGLDDPFPTSSLRTQTEAEASDIAGELAQADTLLAEAASVLAVDQQAVAAAAHSGHDTVATDASAGNGAAEPPPVTIEASLEQENVFWESDAGDEYEGEADAESLSSVFTNPRQRNVERVAAEAVEDADWQQHAGEVSDAHVLNEHSSTSTRS